MATNIPEVLAQFPFMEATQDEAYDHEAAKATINALAPLPSFYTFDEPTPCYTLTVTVVEGKVQVTVTDDEGNVVGDVFNGLETAYDYVRNELQGDIVFAGDMEAATGEKDNDMMVTVPVTGSNGRTHHRLLMSRTDSDTEYMAKSNYLYFLKSTLRYEANATDFMTCFHWLNGHPAFWTRYSVDRNDWNTESNGSIWLGVTTDNDGKPVIMLETGGAVEPERTSRYHDLRLDVYAPTYEQAIVQLAAKVHKFFDVDGSERENVEYQKSALELKLDESIKEYENESGTLAKE
jgi:hypothetical protein